MSLDPLLGKILIHRLQKFNTFSGITQETLEKEIAISPCSVEDGDPLILLAPYIENTSLVLHILFPLNLSRVRIELLWGPQAKKKENNKK